MKKTPIHPDQREFPETFHPLLKDAPLFDSSCSKAARVYFIDKDEGYYLKHSDKGRLQREAEMTAYFHALGLATEVLQYQSLDQDWLLTRAVKGEDCTHQTYLVDPKRLCDTIGEQLRALHEIDPADCPVKDRTSIYLQGAKRGYEAGVFSPYVLPENSDVTDADTAWRIVEQNASWLACDTLLHGDYCLPNIMLDNWRFSAFIDVDGGGVGDRHVDLFWGIWSLHYNLKTDAYRARFLDAYGRDKVNEDILRVISAIEVFG